MVEGKRGGERIGGKEPGRRRIVPGPEFSFGVHQEHRGNGMVPGIAARIGVGVELLHHLAGEAGFFFQFPDHGRLQGFPRFDKTSRQRPPGRYELALDEKKRISGDDHHCIHGQTRLVMAVGGAVAMGTDDPV